MAYGSPQQVLAALCKRRQYLSGECLGVVLMEVVAYLDQDLLSSGPAAGAADINRRRWPRIRQPEQLGEGGGELIRAIGDALPDDLEIAVALPDLRRDRVMADPVERLGVDALFTLRLAHGQRCDIYAIGDQPAACGRRARTPLLRRSTRALRSIEGD